jgi:hypothetical protein
MKNLLLLLVGAAVGIAANVWMQSRGEVSSAAYDQSRDQTVPTAPAAAASNALDLEATYDDLDDLISASPDTSDTAEIAVRLLRYAELDPERAFDFARRHALPEWLTKLLFVRTARVDRDLAFRELRRVSNDAFRRRLALELMKVYGADGFEMARLAELLPEQAHAGFRMEALTVSGFDDPERLATEIAKLPGSVLRHKAIAEMSRTIGRTNPEAAAELVENAAFANDKLRLTASFLAGWAEVDPLGALAYLRTADVDALMSVPELGAIRAIAERAPNELLAIADGLPVQVGQRRMLRQASFVALSKRFPSEAIARAEGMPAGVDRDALLLAAAQSYARDDPTAAFAWVTSLSPPSDNALAAVVATIAETDFERAAQVVRDSAGRRASQIVARLPLESAILDLPRFASSLEALGESHRQALRNLSARWIDRDTEGALRWLLVSSERTDEQLLSVAARELSVKDLARAASVLDRLPERERSTWLAAILPRYARSDAEAAKRLVLRLPQGDSRDSALAQLLSAALSVSPTVESSMLAAFSSSAARDAAIEDILDEIDFQNAHKAEALRGHISDPALVARFDETLRRIRD